MFLHFPILKASCHCSEKDISKPLHIPGLPPMVSLDFPGPCRDRNDMAYQYLLESSPEMSSSAGVIINIFYTLEHRALDAVKKGECRPGKQIPTFCVGPLVSSNDGVNGAEECQTWLDCQPTGSAVFLCFGSMGVFPEQQLKAVATGLETSGRIFL
ncbi:hypothetical protein MLD38_030411 [Melastoma candidum]|uniref:Uncharacterized protein n=1 Tax=Melastoma candidum TaxID=119954 RepID=A0ACB9ML40_9MYRT|nr:hypothetical protein MLD38_030411 [Melastoma candidum]